MEHMCKCLEGMHSWRDLEVKNFTLSCYPSQECTLITGVCSELCFSWQGLFHASVWKFLYRPSTSGGPGSPGALGKTTLGTPTPHQHIGIAQTFHTLYKHNVKAIANFVHKGALYNYLTTITTIKIHIHKLCHPPEMSLFERAQRKLRSGSVLPLLHLQS